ncbi:MAG TPA: rhodanese-like domain-containing protein [Pyrinomonadaceae bacterium]|nr:rhodanese-like domain-containing protein [Pyrinomonadaceae bacterium]
MRNYRSAAAVLICAAAVMTWAACKATDDGNAPTVRATPQATTAAPNKPGDGVRRISVAESQQMLENGEAVLIDVRDELSYKGGHIKGSLSIPRTDLQKRLNELPKDKLIIFYCA